MQKEQTEVPAVKEAEKEIDTFCPEVALALKFLYTAMPLSDVGNYGVSSFLTMQSMEFSSGRTALM